MKEQFNLEKYNRLVAEGKTPKVVTRDGKSARIICTNKKGDYHVVAVILESENVENTRTYMDDGRHLEGCIDHTDLFFSTEPTYRPYKDAEEFLKAQKEHGSHLFACGQYHLPTLVDNECIVTVSISGAVAHRYDEMLGTYIWQDGMPCGVKEE